MTRNLVFVILLALLNHRGIFCNATQVETTISNSRSIADYFVITTPNKDNTITCPASKGCYIHCTGYEHCRRLNVASSKSGPPTWLYLECSGEDSMVCTELSISVSPTQSAEIICSAPYACYDAQFTLSTTRAVNIRCTNHQSCANLHVYASKSDELLLSCDGYGACAFATIYPPHRQQYAFAMTCSDDQRSCWGAKVHVPSSSASSSQSVDNYMQLICPTNNKKEDTCSLDFYCNPTEHVTMMEWNSASLRYECADTVCCPWSNPNNMRRPPEIPSSVVVEEKQILKQSSDEIAASEELEVEGSEVGEEIEPTEQLGQNAKKHNMNKATVAIAVCFVLLAADYIFGLRHGRAQHDHGANGNLIRPAQVAAPLPIGNDDNAAAVVGHDEVGNVDEEKSTDTMRIALKSEIDAVKQEMLQTQSMKSLQTKLSKQEKAIKKAAVLTETVNAQKSQIQQLSEEKEKLVKLQTSMETIRTEFDNVREQRDAMKQQLQRSNKNETTFQQKVNSLQQEINDLQPLKAYADCQDLAALDEQALSAMEKQLEEKLKSIKEAKRDMSICIVCHDSARNHALLPCGHLCICGDCKQHYEETDAVCPICRTKVTKVVRLYHS